MFFSKILLPIDIYYVMLTFTEFLKKRTDEAVGNAAGSVDAERSRLNALADPNKNPEEYGRIKKLIADKFGGSITTFLSAARKNPEIWAKASGAAHGLAQGAEDPRKMLY